MAQRLAIGIDLGGTFIKAGLVAESGDSLGQWKQPTGASGGPDAVKEALVAVTRTILESEEFRKANATGNASLAGIGLGSPGVVDSDAGIIKSATSNLPGWAGTPIGPDLQKEFGFDVFLDNDANAYAWGEYHFGAARGRAPRVLLALTLGTGVGGGIVIGGKLYHGAHGCGGELGHVPVSDRGDAPLCSCGNRGCLESFVSAPSLVRSAFHHAEDFPDSLIFRTAAGETVTAKHIYDAATHGDLLALQVIRRAAEHLGRGLAGLVSSFDPDLVVLGGGVANLGEFLFPTVCEVVRKRVFFSSVAPLEIIPAKLGSEEGYLGAAALALFSTK